MFTKQLFLQIYFYLPTKKSEWKLVGSVQANNILNLPESFSELKVDILGNNYSYSIDFIYEQLNSSEKSYIIGYGAVSSNGQPISSYCILKISRTRIYVKAYMEDSVQVVSTLTVFYR